MIGRDNLSIENELLDLPKIGAEYERLLEHKRRS